MSIKLLDCTLRDGGYLNNWNFGFNNSRYIIQNLVNAGLDAIEIGFLDKDAMPNKKLNSTSVMEEFNQMLLGLELKDTEIYAMIDYGKFDIENVLDKKDSLLTGIRVIFTQEHIEEALEYCRKLKQKGYKVFANAVNITNYDTNDYQRLIACVNDVHPDAVTIVDTYGVMMPEMLKNIYSMFDASISTDIGIGFHAHNTLQMATANCINIIGYCNRNRINYIDGTISGMGKGSGNAYTELLLSYINKNCIDLKHFNLVPILEILERVMPEINCSYSWPFSPERFISSYYDVYYRYTDYYRKLKNIKYGDILAIEALISDNDRFNYSQEKADYYMQQYFSSHRMYDYAIFDIDGTLLDSSEGILKSIDYTIQECKLPELGYENKLYFIGPPIQDSFRKAYGLTVEEANKVAAVFRKRYKEHDLYFAKPYDGIIELLQRLKEEGIKIGVATNKREDYALDLLKYFGIADYCDSIHGSDFEGRLSKDDVIAKVIEELGIKDLSKAVMIGDSTSDYTGAQANNIDFLGVSYGYGFKDEQGGRQLCLVGTTRKIGDSIIR